MSWWRAGGVGRVCRNGRVALFGAALVAAILAVPRPAAAHAPACPETWNPATQPQAHPGVPAGWSTPPGTENRNTPINPDGFFILTSDAGAVRLFDGCGCTGFGGTTPDEGGGTCTAFHELVDLTAFPTPLTIKYTEANGKDPDIKLMAGSQQPGSPAGDSSDYIQWHLWGQGDLEVCNIVGCTCCRVPPPPFSDEPAPTPD